MTLTLIGTPTQARAFLDSIGMHSEHLEQDGPRITAHPKEYPMTECQLGLHRPALSRRDELHAIVCTICGRTLSHVVTEGAAA